MPVFVDPGIIRFELGDRVLSTHYRSELFEDGTIDVDNGTLTISNGFAASLAEDLADGAEYGFSLGSEAQLDIVDNYANLKLLGLVMEKAGIDVESLFGEGSVGITLQDTPENIQAALLEPGLSLFNNIVSIDLVLEEGAEEPPIRVPLDKYSPSIDFSAFGFVEVFGTLEDYLESPLDLPSLDEPVTFVVEDTLASFTLAVEFGISPTDSETAANLTVVDASNFRMIDTVENLESAAGDLVETDFDGYYVTYGAVDTLANIETGLVGEGASLLLLGVESLALRDTVTHLSTLSASVDVEALDGVTVVDSVASLDTVDFSAGYLPATSAIIASDTAEALAVLLADPDAGPIEVAADRLLSGIEVLSGTTPLALDFTDIVSLELSSLTGYDGALRLQGSVAEIATAGSGVGPTASVIDRFTTLDGADIYGVDTALLVNGFLPLIDSLDNDVKMSLAGFDILRDEDSLFNTLSIDAAYASDDVLARDAVGITDQLLVFNALEEGTFIFLSGDAAVVADNTSFQPDLYINVDPASAGGANIAVYDDASAIADVATELAARDESDADTVFTIGGFNTSFTHLVSYDDIYDSGEDGIAGTVDDVASSLPSFSYANDWYELQEDVFSTEWTFTPRVTIEGNFDVESSGTVDVVDISAQTQSFDSDDNPAQDFAFVSSLTGSRYNGDSDEFQTVGGKPAVDIEINETESTTVAFDGLLGDSEYDGVADFEIYFPNVFIEGQQDTTDLDSDDDTTDINNGLTIFSFFGIPLVDQVTGDSFFDETTFPTLDILRFEGQDVFGSAAQVFNILDARFYGIPDVRNLEIDDLFNVEGDILLGDEGGTGDPEDDEIFGDALAPLVNDVLFGLDGDDDIFSGDGDDQISGGPGNDELFGQAGNDLLLGGDGADDLFGEANDDTLLGGDNGDRLFGGSGDDSLDGGSGADELYGEDNDDLIYGGGGSDSAFGGDGDDDIWGDGGSDSLDGGIGDDDLFGGNGNDTLIGGAGDDALDGGGGTDTADYSDALEDVDASLADGVESADGADIGTDTLTNIENLTGGAGDDILVGNGDANVLIGGAGIDDLQAGAGDDTLIGGSGDDTLDGGADNDTADYSGATEGVDASLAFGEETAFTIGGTEIGTDTLIDIENLTGGAGDDILTGDNLANTLRGGAGMDTLEGGEGGDTLIGGANQDTLSGGNGDDLLQGGAGADTLTGGFGNDIFSFVAANDFGDTITDFTITSTEADSIELGRGALKSEFGFFDFGLTSNSSTSFLTGSTQYFVLNNAQFFSTYNTITTTYSTTYGFLSGLAFDFNTANDIANLNYENFGVPILTGFFESGFTVGPDENSFASAFKNDLVGKFAPTQITGLNTTFNSAAFSTTTDGSLILRTTTPTGSPPLPAPFTATTVEGRFMAFGLVRNTATATPSAALVVAYINNGAAGTGTAGGLNSITSLEISAFTIAVFDPDTGSTPSTGDVFLI